MRTAPGNRLQPVLLTGPSTRDPAGGVPASPPTFWEGVLALPAAARFIAARPSTWLAAAVPCAIMLAIALPLVWFAIADVGPWLANWLLPDASSWYAQGAHALARWIASALAIYLSFGIALSSAPVLSAPALEHLVRAQESALGAPERPKHSVWFELRCGLEAQLGALALVLPLWIAYWLVAALLPGAGLLLLPLQALPLSLGLAWNLFDYPLTLRGVRARARLQLLRQHPGPILGLGSSFALVTCIPGAALLLLPVGVVAAARLSFRLLPATHDRTPHRLE